MIGPGQRWDRRAERRPRGELIDPSRFDVGVIDRDRARLFVEREHYEHSLGVTRRAFGMFNQRGALAGVAAFTVPMHPAVLDALPCDVDERAYLGRFVLRPEVPGNGESWFLARCFELLRREGYRGVVSDSDPMKRYDAAGALVFGGHVGTIYQATNARYIGLTPRRTRRLLPDGSVYCARAISKVRSSERNAAGPIAILESFGADRLGPREDPRAWLATWLPRITRAVRHVGSHRYLFGLDPRTRKRLPAGQIYPKMDTQ